MTEFYLEGLLKENWPCIYNKQITPYKVLCTDFIHSLQNLETYSFASKVLRLVNKNPYGALSMK